MFDTLVFICTFSLTCPMTFLESDLLILSLLICERVTVTLLWSCSWDSGPLSEVIHMLCQWGRLMQPQPSHPGMARHWCDGFRSQDNPREALWLAHHPQVRMKWRSDSNPGRSQTSGSGLSPPSLMTYRVPTHHQNITLSSPAFPGGTNPPPHGSLRRPQSCHH